MNKPLPCPWCDRQPREYDSHINPALSDFECVNDNCPMPDDAALARGRHYSDRVVAVAAWNAAVEEDRATLAAR